MSTMLAEGDDLSGAEKVFAFFRDALLDGSLKAGERLLGERELSLRLGVSRPLLREALRSLAMLGFLDIRHGKGAYVRAKPTSTSCPTSSPSASPSSPIRPSRA